jgi:hypothetical protein
MILAQPQTGVDMLMALIAMGMPLWLFLLLVAGILAMLVGFLTRIRGIWLGGVALVAMAVVAGYAVAQWTGWGRSVFSMWADGLAWLTGMKGGAE